MKDLLLGAAANYTAAMMRNLIRSFRAFNKDADIVLLVDAAARSSMAPEFPDVQFVDFNHRSYGTNAPHNARFFAKHEFLMRNPYYRNVLLPDTRDTVFQADPFENFPEDALYCVQEDTHVTIGEEPYTSGWVRQIYGESRLAEVSARPVVCAGTIIGSASRIVALIQAMCVEMRSANPQLFQNMYMDQGVLNHICYAPMAADLNITLMPNGMHTGTVGMSVTGDGKPRDSVEIDLERAQVVVRGLRPTLLHQYDRCPQISGMFSTIYGNAS